jgi:branched-chain amino acid transport system permease protein
MIGPANLLRVAAAILVIGTIVAFGAWANNYLLQAGTTLAMAVVLCLSWNLVGGYMGYPSFATAALFGLGAYVGGIIQSVEVPLALAWAAAALGGALFALVLGGILLRLRGHYFAIGSIAVVEVMREIANNWDSVTGGAIGFNVPILAGSPRVVGIFFYVAMWTLALVTFILTAAIANSRFGFGLRCIRQNEDAARMVGIDVFRFKVAAFVISGLVAALAGAVYASMVAYIEAKDVFNILLSIEVPVMVMLGGAGTLLGPLLGASLYVLLKELVWVHFINFH